jgi:micrococcal nuclease
MGRDADPDGRRQALLRLGMAGLLCGMASFAAAAERGSETLCRFSQTTAGTVAEIVDGDMLKLDSGAVVRLAGIEVPAVAGEDRWRAEAERFLRDTTLGRRVILSPLANDRYGRLGANVHLTDGRWLQAELLAAGLARVRPSPGETGCAWALLDSEAPARRMILGIWKSPAFAVRTADDPSLLAQSGLYEVVEGRVVSVARGLRLAFIDFGRDFRHDFTVMVPKAIVDDLAASGMPLESLRGRRVRVRGLIEESGGPAIRLADPVELELVDEDDTGGDGE